MIKSLQAWQSVPEPAGLPIQRRHDYNCQQYHFQKDDFIYTLEKFPKFVTLGSNRDGIVGISLRHSEKEAESY